MSQIQPNKQSGQDQVMPSRMTDALKQYRKRVWAIKLAEGALAAIFGLVISYFAVFGLDRLVDTPALLRGGILAVGMVGMVILFPIKYHNWVWRHRRLDGVAKLLRHKFPRLSDHVLAVVELARSDSDQSSSRTLIEAAMRQVDDEVAKHNLKDAVPQPRHLRWVWAAGIPLILFTVGMFLVPDASRNALARWLIPWRNVERYTFAQLEGETELQVVAYAEPFSIEARLKDKSPWKPASGKARYTDQAPIVASLEGETYRFQIPPQTKDGYLTLRVGDARRSIPVEPKLRPELTEFVAQVQLPAYLERPDIEIKDVRGGVLALVEGSTATLEATATRELAQAMLDDRPQRVDGQRITTEPISADTKTQVRLMWWDHFGLATREPQVLRIEAIDDEAPTVGFNKLKNNQVILSSEVIAFEIHARDDFGVKRIGLEWEGLQHSISNPNPSSGEKTASAGAPTAEAMTVSGTFSIERENVRPQSLRLRSFAEDYLPGRERAYSPYILLHILTPLEHLKWLTDQLSLWVNAAQEVHDKELQLNQVNRELRNLPPEALDDPAQRKQIQSQAVAERANTARLDSLIEIGKKLVEEATKNEEFEPDQLKLWVEILKKLEEIAGERMPSIAELLAQAADAPGQTEAVPPANPSKPPKDLPAEGPSSPPGGKPTDLEKADKYGPDRVNPLEGLDEIPEDPNIPSGGVNADQSEQPDGKPAYAPANPTPSVLDFESGFNKSEKADQAPQVVGGLGIPVTTLKGSGRDDEEGDTSAPTTAELIILAVQEQQELLDAFAELAADMNKLLMGFENSTFVKRLKATSRRQIDIAVDLNNLDGFGLQDIAPDDKSSRTRLAKREVAESETVFIIFQDMVAYAERRPSQNYSRVLDEMQNTGVSYQIQDMATAINQNFIGQSTIEAEFWADTLDRWAEQLVDPLPPSPPAGELQLIILPNLPPAIILEVLRIINREIQLREETREVEQAKKALTAEEYIKRSKSLNETQKKLAADSREVAAKIRALPNAEERLIQSQLQKVTRAAVVMDEVQEILSQPDTGPKAIAAITEVIEILLETARIPNAPMVVKAPPTSSPALRLLGLGDDNSKAFIENRVPRQATGKAGRILPEEFRQGLDTYFDALEGKQIE